jgi:hypothetical protein
MSVDKEILKKLVKVANNQQKIIHKLAQNVSATPLSNKPSVKINVGIIQNTIDALAGKGVAQVQSASFDEPSAKLMGSVKTNNPAKFDEVRSNIEMVLKRSDALVGEDGQRYTAKEVSLNTF